MAKDNPHGLKAVVLKLHCSDKAQLGKVRCIDGLIVAETEETIWLKGIDNWTKADLQIRQLPISATYFLDAENRLFPIGGLTPIGVLPTLDWQPLSQWLSVEMPVAAFAGKTMERYAAKLIPSQIERSSVALLTDFDRWKTYVETASVIRLNSLKYAVSAKGQVLVVGQPLPAIQGQTYWQQGQLLIPLGYDFSLSIVGDLLSRLLSPQKAAYILLDEITEWEKIPMTALVSVSRSGVKLTELPNPNE